MELAEVEAFVAIQRAGGFTRAAELLRVSQPAVSRRIELLETELGAPLFERLPAGPRLTDAGLAFLPYAQQALAAIADGRAAVAGLAEEAQGTIALALVGTLASTRLTERLQAFRAAHPRVRLHLRTARSDEVSALVRAGDAHLGLRYAQDPHPDVHSLQVLTEPLVVVAAGASELVPGSPREPEALRGIPWVSFPLGEGSSGEPLARALERQLVRCGLDGAERVVIDSLTAQKRLIEADFGVGLLPASSIEEELRLGTLRTLPIPALEGSLPVMAIHRRQAYLGRAVRTLLELLS